MVRLHPVLSEWDGFATERLGGPHMPVFRALGKVVKKMVVWSLTLKIFRLYFSASSSWSKRLLSSG